MQQKAAPVSCTQYTVQKLSVYLQLCAGLIIHTPLTTNTPVQVALKVELRNLLVLTEN